MGLADLGCIYIMAYDDDSTATVSIATFPNFIGFCLSLDGHFLTRDTLSRSDS